MTTLTVEPLDATLGAVVTGVRLADLDHRTWSEIEAAFHEHAVLVFPGQHLTSAEQVEFALRFGPLEHVTEGSGPTPISNTDRTGTLLAPDDPVLSILKGNEGWHTDSSYMPVSAKASMLSAHVVPPSGGDTEWADMRAAYDALGDDLRATVDRLSAHHSIVRSQRILGYEAPATGFYGFHDGPDPLRPLVKIHPVTGRRALFIGRHTYAIPGLDETESAQLLDALLEEACRPPRLYAHHWQVGDLVVWDNRCVLHRARPYDPASARVMKHTRISGDPRTEGCFTS